MELFALWKRRYKIRQEFMLNEFKVAISTFCDKRSKDD